MPHNSCRSIKDFKISGGGLLDPPPFAFTFPSKIPGSTPTMENIQAKVSCPPKKTPSPTPMVKFD